MHFRVSDGRVINARPYNPSNKPEGNYLLHVQSEDVLETWEIYDVESAKDVINIAYADQGRPRPAWSISHLLPAFQFVP